MAKTSELKKMDITQNFIKMLEEYEQILDDEEGKELTFLDLRRCLAEIVGVLKEMIEQGYIMRESILMIVKPDNLTNNSKDNKNYFS